MTVSLTLSSPTFGNMADFLSLAHKRRYPRGSTIIYAGEDSDSIYYITKGSVTVLIEDDTGREIIIAYLNEGDFFSEMAMFGEGTRTA
jgi:CRP/FNR family cyclic AMP-dependent transcriptional regulator